MLLRQTSNSNSCDFNYLFILWFIAIHFVAYKVQHFICNFYCNNVQKHQPRCYVNAKQWDTYLDHTDAYFKTLRILTITFCRRPKWTELLLRDTFFFSNNFFASNYILQFFLLFHICVTHLNYELFGSAEKHLPSMSFWIVPWHYCDKLTGNLF